MVRVKVVLEGAGYTLRFKNKDWAAMLASHTVAGIRQIQKKREHLCPCCQHYNQVGQVSCLTSCPLRQLCSRLLLDRAVARARAAKREIHSAFARGEDQMPVAALRILKRFRARMRKAVQ